MSTIKRLFIALIAVSAILTTVPPVLAQGPGEFDYQIEGLGFNIGMPPVVFNTSDHTVTWGDIVLDGTMRCLNGDAACQGAGMDGEPVTISLTVEQGKYGPPARTASVIVMEKVMVSSIVAGGQMSGPLAMNARGNFSCLDESCSSAALQMMACSTGGGRQLGLILNLSLGFDAGWTGQPGQHAGAVSGMSGTAYLTQADTPNPVCGGRSVDVVFADDYVPQAPDLPSRGAEVGEVELPETEGATIDRDFVVESATGFLRDGEIILEVKGYFFGQCANAEPQYRLGVWDDADIVHVVVYRALEHASCRGGLAWAAVEVPTGFMMPDSPPPGWDAATSRFPVNVNRQIIAILVG